MMKKILLFSFLITTCLSAENEDRFDLPEFNYEDQVDGDAKNKQLVDIDKEPTAIVNRCVNVITGNLIFNEVDLVVPGPEPIVINRSYSSRNAKKDRHLLRS